MITSLRTKLSISYVLVALIVVLLISVLTNVFVEKHFREYVKQNQEQRNKEIVTTLAGQYRDNNKWNVDVIETIGVSYLESGIIIKLKDNNGNIVWDAAEHNNGMCQRIIEHMANNASNQYGNIKGAYVEVPYSINYKLNKVGVVEIGTYGSNYLNEHDLAFISTMNNVLIIVGVFSLLFALILGTLMAKRLSSPISRVISAAKSIANGFYSDRISEKSNTSEINQLTMTINNLADSMEKQEVLRKRLTGDVAHELRTPIAT
ncbi:MAG: HAMP domain-containing protein, partial [Ruminiclostridium sp.]